MVEMRAFISYTTRDSVINKEYLIELEKIMKSCFDLFIDILYEHNEEPQIKISEEVIKSDVFILICTKGILNSEWVLFEIVLAVVYKIPIVIFIPDKGEFKFIIYKDIKQIVSEIYKYSDSKLN